MTADECLGGWSNTSFHDFYILIRQFLTLLAIEGEQGLGLAVAKRVLQVA